MTIDEARETIEKAKVGAPLTGEHRAVMLYLLRLADKAYPPEPPAEGQGGES